MLMPGIWARRLRDLRPGGELGVGSREAARTRLLALAVRPSARGRHRPQPPPADPSLAYSTMGWQARSVRPSYSMSATATSTS